MDETESPDKMAESAVPIVPKTTNDFNPFDRNTNYIKTTDWIRSRKSAHTWCVCVCVSVLSLCQIAFCHALLASMAMVWPRFANLKTHTHTYTQIHFYAGRSFISVILAPFDGARKTPKCPKSIDRFCMPLSGSDDAILSRAYRMRMRRRHSKSAN